MKLNEFKNFLVKNSTAQVRFQLPGGEFAPFISTSPKWHGLINGSLIAAELIALTHFAGFKRGLPKTLTIG